MISELLKSIFGKKEKTSDNDYQAIDEQQVKEDLPPIDFDLMTKKEFIRLESAYRHQENILRRATEDNRLTLGEVLNSILNIEKSKVLSLGVMYRVSDDVKESLITDKDCIWNYDLIATVLKNKIDGHYTHGMYHETTLAVSSDARNAIFTVTSLGGTDTVKYMRLTVLSPDNTAIDDCASLKTNNSPIVTSCIISYCEDQNVPDFKIFEIVENEVKRKQNSKEELNEIEREYIHGQFEFCGYYYCGYGKWLYEQKRYYDTLINLKRAFNYFRSRLDEDNEKLMTAYYETCDIIGWCLSELGIEDEAVYFFKQGTPGLALDQPNSLALSLAELGNPVAILKMKDWLKLTTQKYGESANWPEIITSSNKCVLLALNRYKEKYDELLKTSPQYEDSITIGYVLNRVMGLKEKNLAPNMFVYDIKNSRFEEKIENVNSIVDYILNAEKAKDKIFVLSRSHAHYITKDKEDLSILCVNAPLVISTHSIKGNYTNATMRVDIVCSNFWGNDDKMELGQPNQPLNSSFCLGISSDEKYATDKESLLAGIRRAIDLIHERRFIEAYKLAKWTFEYSSHHLKDEQGLKYESHDQLMWDIFFESSYSIGFCLMELNMIRTAGYYLEIASHSRQYTHVQEYINFLSNSKDPLTLSVVEDVISKSPRPENEEDLNTWNKHMAFLKRRKAYCLIDLERFIEARQLLCEMLNDPLCKDFAEGEIRYINAMERRNLSLKNHH